jgi:hypothetical protein
LNIRCSIIKTTVILQHYLSFSGLLPYIQKELHANSSISPVMVTIDTKARSNLIEKRNLGFYAGKIIPKKHRLITCPHCHRAIKVDEFREHFTTNRGKKALNPTRPVKAKTNHTDSSKTKQYKSQSPVQLLICRRGVQKM